MTAPVARLTAGATATRARSSSRSRAEGVAVEVRARTFFGDVRQEAGEVAPAGAPRIVLTGGTFFGDVRVRARRLREKLVEGISGALSRQSPTRP